MFMNRKLCCALSVALSTSVCAFCLAVEPARYDLETYLRYRDTVLIAEVNGTANRFYAYVRRPCVVDGQPGWSDWQYHGVWAFTREVDAYLQKLTDLLGVFNAESNSYGVRSIQSEIDAHVGGWHLSVLVRQVLKGRIQTGQATVRFYLPYHQSVTTNFVEGHKYVMFLRRSGDDLELADLDRDVVEVGQSYRWNVFRGWITTDKLAQEVKNEPVQQLTEEDFLKLVRKSGSVPNAVPLSINPPETPP